MKTFLGKIMVAIIAGRTSFSEFENYVETLFLEWPIYFITCQYQCVLLLKFKQFFHNEF